MYMYVCVSVYMSVCECVSMYLCVVSVRACGSQELIFFSFELICIYCFFPIFNKKFPYDI